MAKCYSKNQLIGYTVKNYNKVNQTVYVILQ